MSVPNEERFTTGRLTVLALIGAATVVLLSASGGGGSSQAWTTMQSGSTPWRLHVPPDADDYNPDDESTLFIQYATLAASGDATQPFLRDRLDRLRVREDRSTVTVGVDQSIEATAGRISFVSVGVVVPVALDRPLGGRRLVHAPVDPEMADLEPTEGYFYVEIDGPGPAASGKRPWR